jgi:hypothetical protein
MEKGVGFTNVEVTWRRKSQTPDMCGAPPSLKGETIKMKILGFEPLFLAFNLQKVN